MFVWLYDKFQWLVRNDSLADYFYYGTGGGLIPNVTGLVCLIVCGLSVAIFYYFGDSVSGKRFNAWMKWFMFVVVVNFAAAFLGIIYLLTNNVNINAGNDSGYSDPIYASISDAISFGLANVVVSIVLFFALSVIAKRWSTNNCFVPFKFPE